MDPPPTYADRIKPANFLLSAQVIPFGHPDGADPSRFPLLAPAARTGWLSLPWVDEYSGTAVTVGVGDEVRFALFRGRAIQAAARTNEFDFVVVSWGFSDKERTAIFEMHEVVTRSEPNEGSTRRPGCSGPCLFA